MAGDAGSIGRRAARRIDATGDSGQGRVMELRAIHIFEHSKSGGAISAQGGYSVGDASTGRLRWIGTGPRGIGNCYQPEAVVCGRSALGLVAGTGGGRGGSVRWGGAGERELNVTRR